MSTHSPKLRKARTLARALKRCGFGLWRRVPRIVRQRRAEA
jgi:hypothetical protein